MTFPDTLKAMCARPACRAFFDVSMGRGRPKQHCSEECRRAVSVVRHFESLVRMAKTDVARFGRGMDEAAPPAPTEERPAAEGGGGRE